MSLIGLLIVLVILGVSLYLVNAYLPIAAPIKTVINVVVVLIIIIWLLQAFGLVGRLGGPIVVK